MPVFRFAVWGIEKSSDFAIKGEPNRYFSKKIHSCEHTCVFTQSTSKDL